MRRLAFLGALWVATLAPSARADDAPTPAPPPLAPSDDSLRAEVARQGAAIQDLKASLDKEKSKTENPGIRISGFIQADWVIHDQASQNEIDGSTGLPLNLDRFTLRRGHVRVDAEQGLVLGSLEIDANTTSGPQVRPIDAEVSLRWPEKPDARLPSFMATLGLMRIPFGYEVQELDYVRPFLERATMLAGALPRRVRPRRALRGEVPLPRLGARRHERQPDRRQGLSRSRPRPGKGHGRPHSASTSRSRRACASRRASRGTPGRAFTRGRQPRRRS